jgi:tetratricopeptide (TPR) repeat protein
MFHYMRACALMQQGDHDEAAAAVQEALVFHHGSAVLHALMSETLLRRGQFANALAEADRAVELDPKSLEGHAIRSAALWEAQRFSDAEPSLREVVGQEPGRVQEAQRLMELRVANGDLEGARQVAAALTRVRQEPEAMLLLAQVCERKGHWACVDAELAAAGQKAPQSMLVCTARALFLDEQGRVEEAPKAWEACLQLDATHEEADSAWMVALARAGRFQELQTRTHALLVSGGAERVSNVGHALLRAQQAEEAERLARAALASFGPGELTLALLGLALAQQGRCADAEVALAQTRPVGDPMVERVKCLLRRRDHPAALDILDDPLARSSPDLALLRCRALAAAGRDREAGELARAVEGQGSEARVAAAQCLAVAGASAQAMSLTEQALGQAPDDATLLLQHALVQWEAGSRESAMGTLRALLAVHPEHAEAQNFLAYALIQTGGDGQEALRLAEAAHRRLPASGEVVDTLAMALSGVGRDHEAREMVERAARMLPFEPEVWLHVGDLRAAAAQTTARLAWERGLSLLPLETDIETALRGRLGNP